MLSVKQTAKIISTYTGDTSGVCSALFELGGMTVMHDPSGCNSTYNTHDEPRWYDSDSLVFISALTEAEAIMGDDDKLFRDTLEAASELKPKFIALAGSPIPSLIGTDLDAVAYRLEQELGIVSFGFATDGMHSYVSGASMAFAALARRISKPCEKSERLSVNILGVTPLDFSVTGNVDDMKRALEQNGISINGCWAMGGDISDIENAAAAHVNLVVSSCGLEAARILENRFGIPFVVGTPCGGFTERVIESVKNAAVTLKSEILCVPKGGKTVIIGESVTACSLACALEAEGIGARVISAVDTDALLLGETCVNAVDEDEIIPLLSEADCVIADPLYRPIVPNGVKFVSLPHEAFSGRIYRRDIPRLVNSIEEIIKEF